MTSREGISTSSEVDSEGSSIGDERDGQKRLREDTDSGNPKKRRKQTTPVRVSACHLTTEEKTESDEEFQHDKETRLEEAAAAAVAAAAAAAAAADDDNGDDDDDDDDDDADDNDDDNDEKDNKNKSSLKCEYCGDRFEEYEGLSMHLESQHSMRQENLRIKVEMQQEEGENPVNLSGLSIKNFASSWMSSSTSQSSQLQTSQEANPSDWIASNLPIGLPFSGGLAQYLPIPGFSMSDPGQLPRLPVGPAPIRIFNLDAYCDLCNKEFCNKYFLKTHKANKHGIYVDTQTQQPLNDNNGMNYSNIHAFHQHPLMANKIDQSLLPQIMPKFEIPCDICQKKFKNEDSLRKHKLKSHSELHSDESHSFNMMTTTTTSTTASGDESKDHIATSPGAMERLFKQEYGIEQEDSKFMPAPRHLSPQSSQQAREAGFSVDRLKRLGVLNVEAFCEICCKEYCNKYFLRTHKMKRHGIVIQDNEKSPSTPGAAATWHQIQTSPLNLIVTDNTNLPGGSESNDNSDEYECKICGIKFQTQNLYQTHLAKIHENPSEDDEKSPKHDNEDERTDSISDDLQKIQTMIWQLKKLESTKTSTCEICGRECENKLALRTHMNLEHGKNIVDEITASSPLTGQPHDNNSSLTICTICQKDFSTNDALRQHISEEHNQQAASLALMKNNSPFTTSSGNAQLLSSSVSASSPPQVQPAVVPPIPPPPDKKLSSLTPTSSYCEICHKELCNKYFMKTHMQRMHGIEIENGSQIGGVICNICNKELCSKYFLRVHKHNTHGIIEEGNASAANNTNNKQETFDNPSTHQMAGDDAAAAAAAAALKPDQLGDLSHRYFTHFNEVCPICNRRFRSIKWLKAHLLADHGKTGIEKWRELEQQYQNVTIRTRQQGGGGGGMASSTKLSSQQNANIKIPSSLDLSQNLKTSEFGLLGNQVLSTLLASGGSGSGSGGANEEQQVKHYKCSYCNFTTAVLPFLFLHERSHMSNQESTTTEHGLNCPICSQTFTQAELLHHHLIVRHQFSNLLSQYQHLINESQVDVSQEQRDVIIDHKERQLSKNEGENVNHPSIMNSPINTTTKNQKEETGVIHVTGQSAYKCAECAFTTANLHRIKTHVKKSHKVKGDPTESVITELSKTLRDVANKHKVPVSYAMPQDFNSNPDTTIMQPFIIEEQQNSGFSGDESSSIERTFAPVLVYLPVRTRINTVLTTSFTLSPASIIS